MNKQFEQDLDLIHKHCAASLCPEHFEAWDRIAAALNAQPQSQPSPQVSAEDDGMSIAEKAYATERLRYLLDISAEDVALVDELVRQSGLAGPTMKGAWQRIRAALTKGEE